MIKTLPWCSALLMALCLLIYWLAPFDGELFHYLALNQSYPQRVISWLSAHFSHSDANHLLWNLAALAVLGAIIENHGRALLLVTLLAAVVALDAWFFWQVQFQVYVGFSGVLNALLVAALYVLRRPGHGWRGNEILWLVFVLAIVKSIYELLNGGALFSATRWPTTPSFHLIGLASGALTVLLWHRLIYSRIASHG